MIPSAMDAGAVSLTTIFTVEKLWQGAWPVLAGAIVVALVIWLSRRFGGSSSAVEPSGDVGGPVLRLLGWLWAQLFRRGSQRAAAPAQTAPASTLRARLSSLGQTVDRVEQTLRSWPVAGCGLLVIMGVLLWLLVRGG